MYEYQEYPKMLYGPNGGTVIVQDREGEDALGDEWSTLPLAGAGTPEPPPAPVVAMSAPEDETQAWLTRAAAVSLRTDRRWGIETLKGRVMEAEALARA